MKDLRSKLLDESPDAILALSPDGTILHWNKTAETMFGYTRDEAMNKSVFALIVPSAEVNIARKTVAISIERKTLVRDAICRRKDGQNLYADISAQPARDEDGEGRWIAMIIRDVTELKVQPDDELRKNIKDAHRVKSEFLARMSHELRTPLNSVIGFTEFMLDEKPGPLNAKQKEYLQDVFNSGKHLLKLINTILDLAKIEAGKIRLEPEEFEVKAAVQQICSAIIPMAVKQNVRLSTNVAEDSGYVTLDLHKFKQILFNLLSNAIKFTAEGGTVDLEVHKSGDENLNVIVKDTGVGIQEEDIPRLFTEFQQINTNSSRRYEGSGLGLVLTKKIIEMQHGSIQVESKYGVGSTFTVTLPCRYPETPI